MSPETKMHNCFVDYDHRAIADLVDYYGKGLMITRINVPKASRGLGIGSKLLKQITNEADATSTTLFLEIVPSDGLNYGELSRWYFRNGFRQWKGIWRRLPNVRSNLDK